MKQKLLKYLSGRFLPRWMVFLLDISIIYISFFISFLIRYNFDIKEVSFINIFSQSFLILPFFILSFIIFKPFVGVIRHSGRKDLLIIAASLILVLIIELFLSYIGTLTKISEIFIIRYDVIIIHFLLCMLFLAGSRVIIRYVYDLIVSDTDINSKNVLIYGAGRSGNAVLNTLRIDIDTNYKIIGFIDDNPKKHNKAIEGIHVYSFERAKDLFLNNQVYKFNKNKESFSPKNKIDEIIFSINDISIVDKRKLIDKCLPLDCEIHTIAPINEWVNGKLQSKHINKIKIEDLLGRDAIHLDEKNIREGIKNKNILITGAAGSIGSEIVRQLIQFDVRSLILVDQAETQMFYLNLELSNMKNIPVFHIIIADVRDSSRIKNLFEKYEPDIVFHAAAYKHVPLMENNVYEAIRINVFGTKILADISQEYNVKKFVMISTDKAVNPTNIMGASKRIAEIYIQSLHYKNSGNTQFITTRFGNVLGSTGSVIPQFYKQIKKGGPITITHPDITRYFMTIPEACLLVLEAGFIGNGGEIFIFDMGEQIKIIDLAKKMIRFSGLSEHDIQIKITGLRPGEKLYEELLINTENDLPTHNEKIMISQVPKYNYSVVNKAIAQIQDIMKADSEIELVKLMKELIPEFISNNSVYSELDKKTLNQPKTNSSKFIICFFYIKKQLLQF